MEVSLHNISKSFKQKDNSTLNIFSEINLTVNNGQLISLIGPSGCGKSTLLNIIAGIEVQDKGDIYIDKSLEANRLGVCGYLQQKDLLLPWRNILDNVILGSELKGENKKESLYKAKKYLDRFGLKGFEYEYPHNLSGGMRQRASFLRTLLADQKLFLLDEPFSALDSLNRSKMQDWLLNIKKELDKTIILVTHDIDEAILLSDKIYVMSNIPAQIILTENINYPRVNTTTMLSDDNYFKTKKNIMDALSSLEN
ncbi:MAG: ABC transporter ATP-binding protein [Dehalococcoidia bacterium]|nr:ABC transporter ATP-binding protein [SAR202 cluster bacterium]|tara:strand:+ start:300 stop:1061 length:762 start_codon:yes stop_codon:yes gene_type:complete